MPETVSSSPATASANPTEHLPLSFFHYDVLPPAPTRSTSTIDWLLDFAGRSWIAYGAASVLVISHLPSPLSSGEVTIGPVFRQVIEFSLPVTAVAWSHTTPSFGELAVASGNCVSLLAHDCSASNGSSMWSEQGLLENTGRIEGISWSESGDGIVVGGFEVILWKRKANKIWEIAWKFKHSVSQTIVSAAWSIEGFSASATSCYKGDGCFFGDKSSMNVATVYYRNGNGNTQFEKTEICHPQPLSWIQWRPSSGRSLRGFSSQSTRQVLLTCCLDGTVRLWCEIEDLCATKLANENSDRKTTSRRFCLGSVIEINQELLGKIGTNIFVSWATDNYGVYTIGENDTRFYHAERSHDAVGQCDWIIGFGPGTTASFWAVHCLDDQSPFRLPRVTLWKKQDMSHSKELSNVTESKGAVLLHKVVTLRKNLSSSPDICSFIHLLPCNSLVWSSICARKANISETNLGRDSADDESLLCNNMISFEGHSGNIVQVSMNQSIHFSDMAASLDSNGLVLLWPLSNFADRNLEFNPVVSAWPICGKMVNYHTTSKYTSLTWTPLLFGQRSAILLGHAGGIDCFLVNPLNIENELSSYLCSIPLFSEESFDDGPSCIYSIRLASISSQSYKCEKFIILGIWMNNFRALSWEVTVMSIVGEGDGRTDFDGTDSHFFWKVENTIGNLRWIIGVNPWSSKLPEPYCFDQVTCHAVLYPRNAIFPQECSFSPKNDCSYIMATGCSNGTVSLWRSSSQISWELVGKTYVHEGCIDALSISCCGQKIATVRQENHGNESCIVQIWSTVLLLGSGTLVLEGNINVNGLVVSSSWSSLGNGQLILGVCLKNRLHVYSQQRPFPDLAKPFNLPSWTCIATLETLNNVYDFLWGPGVNPILLHDKYFSIHFQWLCISSANCDKVTETGHCPIYSATKSSSDVNDPNDPGSFSKSEGGIEWIPKYNAMKGDFSRCSLVTRSNIKSKPSSIWKMMDIADKLNLKLPVYHPVVLTRNLAAGQWKRANAAVRHFSDFLCSCVCLEKKKKCEMHSHIFSQIMIENYLEGNIVNSSFGSGKQRISDVQSPVKPLFIPFDLKYDDFRDSESESSTNCGLSNLMTTFEECHGSLPFEINKLQMLAAIDLLNEVQHSSSPYKTLDESGRRFWVALRFQQLHFSRRFGRAPYMNEIRVDSQLYCWAFQSDFQDTLLSCFLSQETSWDEMKLLGVGFWYKNVSQLLARMEKLARSQYLRKKDPKECTLLYIALKRIPVLAGLFKLSKDEKDKPLFGFFSRNFQEEKNRAAAIKNAYVLMGRHQFEMAIAFFLLGGDNYSAITICAKNLGDWQLALIISRLVENYGSSLEGHLISKIIIPSALEEKNYWLASLLELQLGDYSQALVHFLGDSCTEVMSIHNVSFSEPDVGIYLLCLTSQNSCRNSFGERNSAILGRWASFLLAASLTYFGFPLEDLDFLVPPSNLEPVSVSRTADDWGNFAALHPLLFQSLNKTLDWISGDVALYLEVQLKVNSNLSYFSKLMTEHPGWSYKNLDSAIPASMTDLDPDYELEKTKFHDKFFLSLSTVEKKYEVDSFCIVNTILVWLHNNGSQALGYDMLLDYVFGKGIPDARNIIDTLGLNGAVMKILRDSCHLISLLTVSSSIASFRHMPFVEYKSLESHLVIFRQKLTQRAIETLRLAIRIFCRPLIDPLGVPTALVDLCEYVARSAFFWFEKNPEGLLFMLNPILASMERSKSYDVDMVKLKDHLATYSESNMYSINFALNKYEDKQLQVCKEMERWYVIGICFWLHFCNLFDQKLKVLIQEEASFSTKAWESKTPFSMSDFFHLGLNENNPTDVGTLSFILANFLRTTLENVLSLHVSLFISYVFWNITNGVHVATFEWLKDGVWLQAEGIPSDVGETMDQRFVSCFNSLWSSCSDSRMISNILNNAQADWSLLVNHFSKPSWTDVYQGVSNVHSHEHSMSNKKDHTYSSSAEFVSSSKGLLSAGHIYFSSQKNRKPVLSQFHDTKEVFKRDGDFFEALCINELDKSQLAISSKKKGILFFSLETEAPYSDQHGYRWTQSDWPSPFPIDSKLSPNPMLTSSINKKEMIPDIDEETIRSSPTSKINMTGASSLSWGIKNNDDLVDRGTTLETLRIRTFSSHPSMPFYLAGSTDTRIYLLEFGNNKLRAIYGGLSDVNVSGISAVQFNSCGNRFAGASLDGIICIYQLDSCGQNTIRPTQTSACFTDHALDVVYLPSSGSAIASAGYSANGLNVVVWDTLAPPTTAQTSIKCHEGGASSISAFETVSGSCSISPFLVTGARNGDIGIHDLRYIPKWKTRYHFSQENGSDSGNQNSNGMMWHIPKAHLSRVTKICTIPATTLFLTGSTDGDVKLWDAKSSNLVHYWPKLHERRTFYQPRSRGIGGVVRAAVTDIHVVSQGFITCGADGTIQYVRISGHSQSQ